MDKNVNTLYEMLVAAEKENNTKNISALRYAIFTIENAEKTIINYLRMMRINYYYLKLMQ